MTMRHLTFTIQVWGEVYIGLLVCGKIRFEILYKMRNYKFSTQVRLFCAWRSIQNFIRRNFLSDTHFKEAEENGSLIDENNCHQNHGVAYKMDQEKLVVGDL